MTMENNPAGSNLPPVGIPPTAAATPTPPRRRKRWLILKIVAALMVVIILLVMLAPTLLSSGPVVSIVLGQVNKQLNGKVQIQSLSLGWFSGVDVKGVQVFDASSARIAGIEHAAIPLPLWKAATGSFTLGNVIVDGLTFDARIDEHGVSNFQQLVKTSPNPAPTPTAQPVATTESRPSMLPNVSADIKLTNCRGTVSQAGQPTIYLTKLDGELKIPDINQPITDTLNAAIKVGEQPEGTIAVNGTAAAIKGNLVDLDSAEIHQTLDVANLSLAAGKPFLPPGTLDALDGVLATHVAIDLTAGKTLLVDASINGKQKITAGGPALKGDTFSTAVFTVAVPKLTGNFPDGFAKWQTGRIKVGSDAGSPPVLFQIDQGQLTATIDAQASALLNVIANLKPGSAGSLLLNDHFDLAALAKQLPHLLNVAPGVTVTSGTLAQNVKANWTADRSTLSATTDVTDVHGARVTTAATTPIALAPIHVGVDAADFGSMDFRDMKLALTSKFASADFHGKTLADLGGALHADLKALSDELGQLVDLRTLNLNGTLDADLAENGQLNAAPYQSKLTMNVAGKDLTVGANVNLPVLQVAMTADLHGSKDEILNSVQNLLLTVKTGDGKSAPEDLLLVSANANLNAVGQNSNSPLDFIKTVHAQIDVPDVKQVMKLTNSVPPQAQTHSEAWPLPRDTGLQGWEEIACVNNSLIAGGGSPGFRAENAADRGFRPRLSRIWPASGIISQALGPVRAASEITKTRLSKLERPAHGPEARVTVTRIADTKVAPASAAPAKPAMEWDSGSLSAIIDVSHDPKGLNTIASINGKNLAFHTGDITYQFKPIVVKLAALVNAGLPGKLVMTDLSGDLGIATLSMPAPIVVSPLMLNPQANGGIKITGTLADLTQLLAAMQGQKPTAYPYRGDYTLTENIVSKGATIALQGGIDVTKFQAYNGSTVTFSEDLLSLANDISYVITTAGDAPGAGTDADLNINTLSASMKSSGALNLTLAGGSVRNLSTERDLNLQPKLDYDLAKLWPIIQPMMGDSYKTLKITGHYQKQFNLTGSYPANQPSTVAIKTVKADGELAVESFDYDGLNIKNLIVPITLADGKAMTVYVGKPAGQNTAAPAVANDTGTIDVGNLTVDLTQDPPRLTTPANHPLIAKVTINPLLAGTYLKDIINNPMFSGANSATGLVDLTIADCADLPLGNLVMLPSPLNTGKIDLLLSITKLNISVGNAVLAKALGNGSFQADVNDGTVAIAKGISTQHIKFVTGSYTLSFDGSVRLKDQAFIPMTMGFPLKTINDKTHAIRDQRIAALLPDEISVVVEGTVSAPNYRLDKSAGKAISDATKKAVTGGLLEQFLKPKH